MGGRKFKRSHKGHAMVKKPSSTHAVILLVAPIKQGCLRGIISMHGQGRKFWLEALLFVLEYLIYLCHLAMFSPSTPEPLP